MAELDSPLLLLSVCYIVLTYSFVVATPNLSIGKRTAVLLLVLFNLALATTAALIEPKLSFDLARHYSDLEVIRASDMTFLEFIFNSDRITSSNYKYMIAFNAFRYVIAKWFPRNALPFFTVFISSTLLSYVLIDSNKDQRIRNYRIGGSLGLFFALMHFLFLYSGIRNGLAAAIAAVGLYLLYYKGRWVTCSILILISGTIHPVVLVTIPILFLSYIRPRIWYGILAYFLPPVMSFGAKLLITSNSGFLRMIGGKYYNYMNVYNYYSGKAFTAATLLMDLLILVSIFCIYKYANKDNSNLTNYIVWYICMDLFFLSNQQIFMRLGYTTAFLSPLIIDRIIQDNNSEMRDILPFGIYCAIVFVGAYMCYKSAQWML